MRELLFLYGTLLPGVASGGMQAVIAGLTSVGRATMRGRLYDLGPYPGAVLDDAAESIVVGQVFELPADPGVLARLDAYEGFEPDRPADSLYLRLRRPATLDDGRTLDGWVYQYNRDPAGAPLVPGGDYAAWRGRA
jgi:gamma-glutamylcyclotransferase (GGCT)/AIG2-like uncharacterized protein YtfP